MRSSIFWVSHAFRHTSVRRCEGLPTGAGAARGHVRPFDVGRFARCALRRVSNGSGWSSHRWVFFGGLVAGLGVSCVERGERGCTSNPDVGSWTCRATPPGQGPPLREAGSRRSVGGLFGKVASMHLAGHGPIGSSLPITSSGWRPWETCARGPTKSRGLRIGVFYFFLSASFRSCCLRWPRFRVVGAGVETSVDKPDTGGASVFNSADLHCDGSMLYGNMACLTS